MTADAQVLFRLEADESGAVRGFTLSRQELDKLRKSANDGAETSDKAAKAAKRHGDAVEQTGKKASASERAMSRLKLAVAGVFTAAALRQVVLYADTMTNLDARLKVVTKSEQALNRAREETFAISQRTSASLESTVELYARLELSLKNTGVAQRDILAVTETINKAMVTSGASAAEAAAAVIQLSQGLAAGALRGDEFRSVAEQAPRILQALQEALGKTRGELKAMADEGLLTTELITTALLQQGAVIDEEFADIPVTVGRAFTQLRNEALLWVSQADEATGASAALAEMIVSLSRNLDSVLAGALAIAIGALVAYTAKAFIAGTATATLTATVSLAAAPYIALAAAVAALTYAFIEHRNRQAEFAVAMDLSTEATNRFSQAVANASEVSETSRLMDQTAQSVELLTEKLRAAEEAYVTYAQANAYALNNPGVRENLDILGAQLTELNVAIEEQTRRFNEAREKQKELIAETENQSDATETLEERIQRLLEGLNGVTGATNDLAKAQATAEKAIEKHGTATERIELLQRQHERTLEGLREQLSGTTEDQELLAQAEEALTAELEEQIEAILDQTDSARILQAALQELSQTAVSPLERKFQELDDMLEDVEEQFGKDSEEANTLRKQIQQLRLELEALNGTAGGSGGILGGIDYQFTNVSALMADSIITGIEDGFQQGIAVFQAGVKDAPIQFAGSAADFLRGGLATFQALKDQGATTLDALNETIAAANIPIVSDVAKVLGFVNDIFGGGLFGTKFETESGSRAFSFGPAGGDGETSFEQSKKKSFFRGTSRRTITEDLDPRTAQAVNELFDAALEAMMGAVQALGVEAPAFIEGAFKETFDENGNITSSISTFFGKAYNESFEEFGQRLIAEQIIAAVGQGTGDVLTTVTSSQRFGDPRLGFEEIITETEVMMNEAHAIAERWRDDAGLLLDGAQLLLAAQDAIQDGSGLFDSLTLTVDVIEDLQHAGETLVETYTRVVASTNLLESSLDVMGADLRKTREEFVRFAEAFTEAAGGIQRAGDLWGAYFETFYEADELLEARLRIARESSAAELADVGLGADTTREQFREIFENVLPTLSAEMLAEWLEAAEALGIYLDLTSEKAEADREAADAAREAAEAEQEAIDAQLQARLAGLGLSEALVEQAAIVNELRNAWDGSTIAQERLVDAIALLADMIEQVRAQFAAAREEIDSITGSAITNLRRETLSDEEVYDELRAEALAKAALIGGADSRQEVLDLVRDITGLTTDARGLVDGTQLNEELIAFLEQVNQGAKDRLELLEEKEIAAAQREIDHTEALVGFGVSVETFVGGLHSFKGDVARGVTDGISEGFEGFDTSGLENASSTFESAVGDFASAVQSINTAKPAVNVSVFVDSAGNVSAQSEVGLQ